MKKPSLGTVAIVTVLALGSGVALAQFIQPGNIPPGLPGSLIPPNAGQPQPGYDNSVEMLPGQSYLIHASDDVAIELYVDVPITVKENMTYENPRIPGKFIIPNQSAFRAQGPVVITRPAGEETIAKLYVRWRYIDTMFSRFSRDVNGTFRPE